MNTIVWIVICAAVWAVAMTVIYAWVRAEGSLHNVSVFT